MQRTEPRGFCQSVTGSLHWGESARSAAQRELFEETGIQAGSLLQNCHHRERFKIMPPWSARYAPNVHFNTEHWFLVRLPARRLIRLNRKEHQAYRWMPAQQAMQAASSRTNRKAIRLLLVNE